jgi:hypothetical protein
MIILIIIKVIIINILMAKAMLFTIGQMNLKQFTILPLVKKVNIAERKVSITLKALREEAGYLENFLFLQKISLWNILKKVEESILKKKTEENLQIIVEVK